MISAVKEMTIGEVASQAGTSASAIRYYEEIGLLPRHPRINGRRRYDPSAVQRLCVINAQQAGFTLGEIRELFFGFAAGTHPMRAGRRWHSVSWPSSMRNCGAFRPCRNSCAKGSTAAA